MNTLVLIWLPVGFFFLLVSCSVSTDKPEEQPEFICACSYDSEAEFHGTRARFEIKDIEPSLCTHLLYSSVELNRGRMSVPKRTEDHLEQLHALRTRNPKLKILMLWGGPLLSNKVVLDVTRNEGMAYNFADTITRLLMQYQLDGIVVHWEPSHKLKRARYVLLMEALRETFDFDPEASRLLLGIVGSNQEEVIKKDYDVPALIAYTDLVFLNPTFVQSGIAERTWFMSPLFCRKDRRSGVHKLCVSKIVKFWFKQGLPRKQTIIGIRPFGARWTLRDTKAFHVGAEVSPTVKPGKYYLYPNGLAYPEICVLLYENETVATYFDETQQMAYLVDGAEWVSYEDEDTIGAKLDWAVKYGLRGVAFHSLNEDDFIGISCGKGNYPLLRLVNEKLESSNLLHTTQVPSVGTILNAAGGFYNPVLQSIFVLYYIITALGSIDFDME